MQVFDASSMIYAWDNYPIGQFPKLWDWLADQIAQGLIQMSVVAVDEVGHKVPECVGWMQAVGLQKMGVSNEILLEASRIKALLEIEEEQYGSGVDENDLIIIATAKLHGYELVTDEAFQPSLPKRKANCKIPAVCNMGSVDVAWLDFLKCIKQSGAVFG